MTKNFVISEFDSKCGRPMPADVFENVKELARNLQIVRDELDAPIRINSAYRSPEHNQAIGGSSRSQHMLGKAADIVIDGYTPEQVATALDKLMEGGFITKGGIGRYNTFTHFDIRGYEARWNG